MLWLHGYGVFILKENITVPWFFIVARDFSNLVEDKEGSCAALQLMIITHEQPGDIRGAFELAVSLKLVDFKVTGN